MSPEEKVSQELKSIMSTLNKVITDVAGQQMGVSLIVFNATPGTRLNYISNCDRLEVMQAMKSLLISWHEGLPNVPAHELN